MLWNPQAMVDVHLRQGLLAGPRRVVNGWAQLIMQLCMAHPAAPATSHLWQVFAQERLCVALRLSLLACAFAALAAAGVRQASGCFARCPRTSYRVNPEAENFAKWRVVHGLTFSGIFSICVQATAVLMPPSCPVSWLAHSRTTCKPADGPLSC